MYGDWILAYEGTEYRFGPPGHPVELVDWEFSSDSYEVDDVSTPRGDGVIFGEDFIQAGELKVSVRIDFTTAPYGAVERARLAWDARSTLIDAWRADRLRTDSNAVAQLTMGGVQMVEGRPRRYRVDDTFQNVGLVTAELYFIPSQPVVYVIADGGEVWHEHTVSLAPAEVGFLSEPLSEPLSAAVGSSNTASFAVGGSTSAWGVFTVRGPLQAGGRLELADRWSAHLGRALRYDDVAVFDTRPGRFRMTLNGAPVNLLAPSGARLSDMSLEPGPHALTLRGTSTEGTASATVRWRDTRGA